MDVSKKNITHLHCLPCPCTQTRKQLDAVGKLIFCFSCFVFFSITKGFRSNMDKFKSTSFKVYFKSFISKKGPHGTMDSIPALHPEAPGLFIRIHKFFLGRKTPCKLDIFLISLGDILANSRFGDVSCLFTVDFPSHHLSQWSLVHLDWEHLLKFNLI